MNLLHPYRVPRLAVALPLLLAFTQAQAQQANPSSASNPYYGSVTVAQVTADPLKLSLDSAIAMGLKNNLGLREAENGEKTVHGERNVAVQEFLPTIAFIADTGVYQHNLAAQGFSKSVIGQFGALFPESELSSFSTITRDDLSEARLTFTQTLFSGPIIAGFKGVRAAERAAHFAKMSARGEVVQQVASAYLHAIAAASEVDNARALEAQDQVQLDHAHDAHMAGTVANLDELRARVQLQSQQQSRLSSENSYQKDLILLKREIGVAPGQVIQLTDPAPYSELALQTPEEVRAVAYQNRQDYQNLQNQAIELKALHDYYRAQRLPTLSFNGNYAVTDVTAAGTHGNFLAQGTLSIPLFREAKLRGDADASLAQQQAIDRQLDDLRSHIDQQVRSALLDVGAARQLVAVARSNVDLATRELSDETDRVTNGVDDNLPLVTAQASVSSAQSNMVESLYQYNLAKLALARSAGILEQQYRDYIGR